MVIHGTRHNRWGVDTAEKMLKQTGFNHVKMHQLDHDIQNAYFIVKK